MENLRVVEASKQVFYYDATKGGSCLLSSSQQAGYFLLKDGSKSFHTVYDQECGIFIDENLYIPLKLSKQKFTAHEARLYYETMEQKIPDLYKIVRLQQALYEVNQSLKAVGMQDYCFSGNVLEDLWYEENLSKADKDAKRRCIIINEYGDYTRPEYQLLRDDYLLYDKRLVYHKEEGKYHPKALTLCLTLSDVDILFLNGLIFWRGKDKCLNYLPADNGVDLIVLGKDLIRCENVLYQACDQGLVKVAKLDEENLYRHTDINICSDTEFETKEYSIMTQEGIPYAEYLTVKKYQKNDKGIYAEISSDQINLYSD